MGKLALVFSAWIALTTPPGSSVRFVRSGAPLQSSEPSPPKATEQATDAYTASEALELVRWAMREKTRDEVREVLHEMLAGLALPAPGQEESHIAALVELERLARELEVFEESRLVWERILEIDRKLYPPDDVIFLKLRFNVAVAKQQLGDLEEAHAEYEEVLEAWTPLVSPDDLDRIQLQSNLAETKLHLGDFEGARKLFEEVLEARTRLLPEDDPLLLAAKGNVAVTRYELGDMEGANAVFEELLSAFARLLPEGHTDLLAAKDNVAATRAALGDIEGARALQEEMLATRERLLPEDHPELLRAKIAYASALEEVGDLEGARRLQKEALEGCNRHFPPDHPFHLVARGSAAMTSLALGDREEAHASLEALLATRSRLLPRDHPDLLLTLANLAIAKEALGDVAGMHQIIPRLLEGIRARARALRMEAPRLARAGARAELRRFSATLYLTTHSDPEGRLDRDLFATLESLRIVSVANSEATHAFDEHPELRERARAIAASRARINDLVAGGAPDEEAVESWRREVVRLAGERDEAERALRQRLAEAGAFVAEIDADAVGAGLAPGEAAVSFLKYTVSFEVDRESRTQPPSADALLAFVVRPGGTVTRVELGPTSELETLIGEWRRALGKPVDRGIAAVSAEERSEPELRRLLRARVLDPVLGAAGQDVRVLHVVLDDFLFLLPLDVLLHEGDAQQERVAVRVEPTLARLLQTRPHSPADGTLVALGGIDFDDAQAAVPVEDGEDGEPAEVAADFPEEAAAPVPVAAPRSLAFSTPPLGRTGRPGAFEPLRQTRYEIEDVAAQFEEAFDAPAVLVQGASASKARLRELAPRARFLHLATHGWFAPEAFQSQLDVQAAEDMRAPWRRAQSTLVGFAPETLCGLALAGANRGRDELGHVPGILTAEELSVLDLRNCELAVLSACETNVGIHRAGQGIQSLQTALHAAGARTAITSLWKVDDAATRRLFELFYAKLWRERLGKADALWQAKMALRAEGHPLRDWAGWVLSGDP